jgi:6-pyruvoyltetrahydropterin/6-carboxytetrahydropterin synthase
MYQVSVQRDFIAYHFLIGGDWGKENYHHAHAYKLELILSGNELDQHGYLVDIVQIENFIEEIVLQYEDKLLNNLPGFIGLNPSLERFVNIITEQFNNKLSSPNIIHLRVNLWENKNAWASYEMER